MDKDNLSHADIERLLTELASPTMQEDERHARMERSRQRACHAARKAINRVFLRRYCVRAAGVTTVLLLLIGTVATLWPLEERPVIAQTKNSTDNNEPAITLNTPAPRLIAEQLTVTNVAEPNISPAQGATELSPALNHAQAQASNKLNNMFGSIIDRFLPATDNEVPVVPIAVVTFEEDDDDFDGSYVIPGDSIKPESSTDLLTRNAEPPPTAQQESVNTPIPSQPAANPSALAHRNNRPVAKKSRSVSTDKLGPAKAELNEATDTYYIPAAPTDFNEVHPAAAPECRFTEAADRLDDILTMLRTRAKAAQAVKNAATAKTYLSYINKTAKESRMAEHILAALNPNEKHDCDFTKRLRARSAEIMTAMTNYAAAEESLLNRLRHANGYGDHTVQEYLKAPITRELCRHIKATQEALKAATAKKKNK